MNAPTAERTHGRRSASRLDERRTGAAPSSPARRGPTAAVKADYWHRYFADSTLNEDWVTASLGAFNDPEQDALTRATSSPRSTRLPWIQRNRRIFFLGSWLGGFMDGQRSAESLTLVEDFLRTHADWPHDLREKILQSEDELVRTVTIRKVCGPSES